MNAKKSIIIAAVMGISASVMAQNTEGVSIKPTVAPPHVSAMLDVEHSNKGVLFPRVSLLSETDATTILTPAHSLIVYNTNANIPKGKGFYYNSGDDINPVWVKFVGAGTGDDLWALHANGTDIFRLNGNVGIGINNNIGNIDYGTPGNPNLSFLKARLNIEHDDDTEMGILIQSKKSGAVVHQLALGCHNGAARMISQGGILMSLNAGGSGNGDFVLTTGDDNVSNSSQELMKVRKSVASASFYYNVYTIGQPTNDPNERVYLYYEGAKATARLNGQQNVALSFGTHNTNDRLFIHQTGRVGIANIQPPHMLSIGAPAGGPTWTSNGWKGSIDLPNGGAIAWGKGNTEYWGIGKADNTNGFYIWKTTSAPGQGNSAADYMLIIHDDGSVHSKSGWFGSSDSTLKKNVAVIPGALKNIMKVDGVYFEWKDANALKGRQMGVIAQNVENVFPEVVYTDKSTGKKTVNYGALAAPMIEAMKEQQAMIEQLQAQVLELNKKVQALEGK